MADSIGKAVSMLEKGPETRPDSACYDSNSRETVKGCLVTVMLNRYTHTRDIYTLLTRRHDFSFFFFFFFLFSFTFTSRRASYLVFAGRTRNGRTNDRGKRSCTPTDSIVTALRSLPPISGLQPSDLSLPARIYFFEKGDDVLI